ncbi:adenosylmethionine--8-amino-7-oxononanoate transaminase [Nocardioides jejuensis]|uniref:Adenosylmethionine-8-amino-7-oxononanoate aminotransferase n=1 Tax=Nocardioides jejuensis TaxID=2502782 RepID=A0A4R1BWS1_9ACTN|nr:adenosylmethionine--8-amino-7-oxononanoate transaminase [Nocardioides jejuensis]TCJ22057.1 adenosylmethionine--8-amino-7-oxononanoate transaminase [Nocardioides jejuensis]
MTSPSAPGSAEDLLAFDREHLWHPYTSMTDPAPVRAVVGASGARLWLSETGAPADAVNVVDGMSSWWSAIHGYRHPRLDQAVKDQVDRFSHVMFGGLTHSPAVTLGRALVELTPEGLDKVFLADSGSVAVEVALKMVLQYQRGAGQPERRRFLTVRGGYHGDTFHPMSVTDPDGGMHSMWRGLLPEHVFAPRPPRLAQRTGSEATDVDDASAGEIDTWAAAFRATAEGHAHELAGIIVEPLLQGAGGMWPYPPACLQVMREVADDLGLLLVFDEIATGFGRTGHLFVSEIVTPDVLCLGKALTGGYMTLAAVVTTDRVARGISASESGVLMHGPTFMGNPLACAVALESLRVLTRSDWTSTVARIGTRLQTGLAPLRDLPGVKDVRTIGAVGIVQLEQRVDVPAATDAAIAAGAWLRPFNDLIYTMPPYVCTDNEVDTIVAAIHAATRASVEATS